MSTTATTDIAAAVSFIKRRFEDIHTGYAVLGFIKDGVTTHGYINLQAPDRWERAARMIELYIETHDCYVAAAIFKETKRWNATKAQKDGKKGGWDYRTTDMIAFVPVLYTDRDQHPYPDTLPAPSYTLETSTGSFQDYYTLDKAIDADTAGHYLRRIAKVCKIGHEAVDAARLLRLPGTINRKPERSGETVRVVTDTGAVYRLADFEHLPQVATGHASRSASNGAGDERKIPEGARHTELVRAAGSMRHYGIGKEHIYEALAGMNDEQCVPPLEDGEVRRIADSANWQPEPPPAIRKSKATNSTHPDEKPAVDPETGEIVAARRLTDYGNAERLVDLHGEDLRFCHPFGKWLSWDRTRWQIDSTAEVMRRAKLTARHIYQEAADAADPATAKELAKHAIRSESDARLRAMIGLAESEPGVPVMPDHLDADPWLFNVESGTVDLKNDSLRAHDRADRITKRANVAHDPTATCPTFEGFLAKVLPSVPLRRFVQRAIGYSLTGDTREDVIFIAFGPGSNGKTTFMQTMQALMGDYAMQTPTETLMVKRGEGIPNDVARLKGARLVAAAEAEQGKRLAESLIKQLTGGDRISARFLRAEWFDFDPTFKIWLSTNHKPVIRGTDLGIWRRIRLIPFTVTIPQHERDEALAEKLLAELPGILNWALAGCRDWLQHGLGLPQEVQEATKSYREEMDILGTWLGDCCVEGINHQAAAAELYASYKRWCEGNGAHPMPQYALGSRLSERGFEAKRGHGGKRYWRGIGLLAPDGAPPPEQPDFASGDTGDTGDANSGISSREKNTIGLCRKPRHPVSPVSPDTDDSAAEAATDEKGTPDAPMTRLEMEAWAKDIGNDWGSSPENLIRAKAGAKAHLHLTTPDDATEMMTADLILAAMKGGR